MLLVDFNRNKGSKRNKLKFGEVKELWLRNLMKPFKGGKGETSFENPRFS